MPSLCSLQDNEDLSGPPQYGQSKHRVMLASCIHVMHMTQYGTFTIKAVHLQTIDTAPTLPQKERFSVVKRDDGSIEKLARYITDWLQLVICRPKACGFCGDRRMTTYYRLCQQYLSKKVCLNSREGVLCCMHHQRVRPAMQCREPG